MLPIDQKQVLEAMPGLSLWRLSEKSVCRSGYAALPQSALSLSQYPPVGVLEWCCLNLIKTDMMATEAHGKTRKNK
jgi:hypothetical protein